MLFERGYYQSLGILEDWGDFAMALLLWLMSSFPVSCTFLIVIFKIVTLFCGFFFLVKHCTPAFPRLAAWHRGGREGIVLCEGHVRTGTHSFICVSASGAACASTLPRHWRVPVPKGPRPSSGPQPRGWRPLLHAAQNHSSEIGSYTNIIN